MISFDKLLNKQRGLETIELYSECGCSCQPGTKYLVVLQWREANSTGSLDDWRLRNSVDEEKRTNDRWQRNLWMQGWVDKSFHGAHHWRLTIFILINCSNTLYELISQLYPMSSFFKLPRMHDQDFAWIRLFQSRAGSLCGCTFHESNRKYISADYRVLFCTLCCPNIWYMMWLLTK